MKKIVKAAGVILVLALSLSACGDSESEESATYGADNEATHEFADSVETNEEAEETEPVVEEVQEPDTKSIEESTDDSPEIEYTEEELYRDAGLYEDSPLRISDIGTINHTNPIKNYTEVWCFLTNNTGLDLRTVEFYVMAWDNSGFPMKLYGNDYGFYYTQDNIPNGMVNLDCKTTIDEAFPTYMAIIPYSYESFDGTTWTNPLGNDGLYEMAQSTISQETMDSGGAWAIRKLDY